MHRDINNANKLQSRSKICGLLWQHTVLARNIICSYPKTSVWICCERLEFDHNSLVESQHTLASIMADRDAFIQQWSTQLSQDLATARGTLDTTQASLEKALRHRDLVRLTAAEDSVVLTVATVSVGSVLKEGDTLFTLMPMNAPVEAEIHVASRDVGFVRAGDRCVLKIDAFNYMEHGTAEGSVRWISDNAFTTDDNNQPVDAYYKARCSVDATHFVDVPPKFQADSRNDFAGRRKCREALRGYVFAERLFARIWRVDARAMRIVVCLFRRFAVSKKRGISIEAGEVSSLFKSVSAMRRCRSFWEEGGRR